MLARPFVDLNDRLHDQCALETYLAAKLRTADRADRAHLYGEVYSEYSERFPESLPVDSRKSELIAHYEKSFLKRFVTPSTIMVEVGPGRCHLAFAMAPLVQKIYGVDVAAGIPSSPDDPPNFEMRLTDGIHLPFDSDSVDLVMSNQLMEHLHPDDASAQLQEIYRILRKGGSYVCVTPSRVNGPHDCSAYFDDLPCPVQGGHYHATGLHLKEYTTSELVAAFKGAGFTRVQNWIGGRGRFVVLPSPVKAAIEDALRVIPPTRRKRSRVLGLVVGHRVRATK